MSDILDKLKECEKNKYNCPLYVLVEAIAEIERLRAGLELATDVQITYRQGLLDAAKMAKAWGEKTGRMQIMLEFAAELRRAAEGVKDAV